MISTVINLKQLYEYEDDYLLWLETNIEILNKCQLDGLDYDSLVEALTDLGRSEKRAVENLLKQLLINLLLYQYWVTEKERIANHWKGEIINFREQLKREFRSKTIYKITQFLNFRKCMALQQRLPRLRVVLLSQGNVLTGLSKRSMKIGCHSTEFGFI